MNIINLDWARIKTVPNIISRTVIWSRVCYTREYENDAWSSELTHLYIYMGELDSAAWSWLKKEQEVRSDCMFSYKRVHVRVEYCKKYYTRKMFLPVASQLV